MVNPENIHVINMICMHIFRYKYVAAVNVAMNLNGQNGGLREEKESYVIKESKISDLKRIMI